MLLLANLIPRASLGRCQYAQVLSKNIMFVASYIRLVSKICLCLAMVDMIVFKADRIIA